MYVYLVEFCFQWEVFHTKCVGKILTQILYPIHFSENCAVFEIRAKYSRTRQATRDNTLLHRKGAVCMAGN